MADRRSNSLLVGLLFLGLFTLIGCSEDTGLNPLPADATILAFGDSLTEGYGVSRDQSYPAILQGMSGYSVINAGISGEITLNGKKRLPDVLAETQPDLVVLIEGGNDILRNLNLTETKNNLAAMIEMIEARDIQVVLIGVPEKNLFSNSAPFYQELADQYEIAFDGSLIASLLRNPRYKSDPIHFNAAGYRKMAEEILRIIESSSD